MAQLQTAQLNGFAPESILDFEQRVAAVTPADVQAAAQRYVDFGNYVQVVLYPEESKPK
jgi:zinc protease